MHEFVQPSVSNELPSSQFSPVSTFPLPQFIVHELGSKTVFHVYPAPINQRLLHPSSLTVF